ncbi:uncharacterized protein LOC131466381 isoform X2 [Solea solea]|uniref:uncharacterized protein LOC131466381 isoform X2 n=1 Tax=Solea solea TaxID=90069 RepID=UPI00272C0DB8|nr:uncharacterized protein LOC131466381 isoform X2 [Solea solea]
MLFPRQLTVKIFLLICVLYYVFLQVHLSDGPGMGLLVDLLLFFSRQQLEMATVVEVEHSLPPVAPSPAPAQIGVKRRRSTPAPKKSRGNQEVELEEEWPELRRAVAEVPVERPRRRIGSQRRRTRQQEGAAADVVEVMTGPSPASSVTTEDLPCSTLHSSPDSIKAELSDATLQIPADVKHTHEDETFSRL